MASHLLDAKSTDVTKQEGNWIMFPCEKNKFLGFWFLFSVAVKFLHVNGENYSVIVC
jgi:hypothetical protein